MRGRLPNFSSVATSSTGLQVRGHRWATVAVAVLLAGAGLGFSSVARAEKPTSAQYWAQTSMSFQFLENSVWDCEGSRLLACVQSLNVGAAAMNPKAIFATASEARAHSPAVGEKIKTFGSLSLYLLREDFSEGLNRAKLQRRQTAQKLQIAAMAELTRMHVKPNIGALLRATQKAMLNGDPGGEAFLAGQMANAFLNAAYDPHTHVMPAQQDLDRMQDADNNFSGIGAMVEDSDGQLIVRQLIEGGGAAAAGLRARDVIVAVNGVGVAGQSVEQLATHLHGVDGTSVELTVQRKHQTLSMLVVRGKINAPNVAAKILNDLGKKIGYLKLGSFMDESACNKLQAEIRNLSWSGAEALIVDLRGNGGGLLSEATCIGALFVGKKVIVQERTASGRPVRTYIGTKNAVTKLPMVTLIDGDSASASEILAGALQDHKRSLILGARSFGKGTMQDMNEISGKLVLYKTVARFYLPSGRTNQAVGIVPDIALDPFPGATEDDKFALREADAYTNALPALGRVWKQTRPQFVQKIHACLEQNQRAAHFYEAHENDTFQPDYQTLAAEEALLCEGPPAP